MLALFLISVANAQAWIIDGELGPCNRVEVAELFTKAPPGWSTELDLKELSGLSNAAEETLEYLETIDDARGNQAGLFEKLGHSVEDVKGGLRLIKMTGSSSPQKLQQNSWWEEHFELWWWNTGALPCSPQTVNGSLRLTKYVIYEANGCRQKGPDCEQALWALPQDEAGLSQEDADKSPNLTRHKITRQQVLSGIFEEELLGQSRPLVWVSEETVHRALMQGTVRIKYADGSMQHYNVHRPNRHPYIHGKPSEEQQRYWFFRSVDGPVGWGVEADKRIPISDYSVVAGDVDNLGLGKLFLLHSSSRSTIAVLADTGGAFEANLRQLDWFVGATPNEEALKEKLELHPPYVEAGLLLLK